MLPRPLLRFAPIALACIPGVTHAQAASHGRPAFTPERYDEDWSFLRDRSRRADLFDPIKWIPLGKGGAWFLTFGGEVRERFQDVRNPAFGLPSPVRNTDVFHRTYLFADVHLGHFRTFVELVNGETRGTTKKPSTFEQDPFDLLQAFADVFAALGNGEAITLRVGRQEMVLGSARLVSLREAPNVRRAFDGARALWTAGTGKRIDAFIVRPVTPRLGVFDDVADRTQLFWGVYSSRQVPSIKGLSLDLYYLGLDRKGGQFAQGLARERRHTLGARFFGKRAGFDWDVEPFSFDSPNSAEVESRFDWDVEPAVQFGSFGAAKINAWMVSSSWGYTFLQLRYSPRFGLKADVASGDRNLQDNKLGTFNPLFPALLYYSPVRLFEPANLSNVQPNVGVVLGKGVTANAAWSALWRESKADAFYAPPLVPVSGTVKSDRFIGQQTSVNLAWKATRHLTIAGNYTHFLPRGSVRQVGGRSGDYFLALAQFKF
jgi:hypothetical protein